MLQEHTILILLLAVMAYALLARRIEASPITLPMIFTGLGWAIGAGGLGIVDLEIGQRLVHVVAEITLILVLFTDASHVRLASLKRSGNMPGRLLLIGMPLTIILGTALVAFIAPGTSLAGALLIAAILTPTDAALGQAVATDHNVPPDVRQAISVESGLNDGLALPVVMIAAVLAVTATGASVDGVAHGPVMFTLMQIVLGPIAGVAVGYIATRAIDWAVEAHQTTVLFQGIYGLCAAFVAYLAADMIGGNGFIAAFIAGMVSGNLKRTPSDFAYAFMNSGGQLLTMFAFVVFGAIMIPIGFAHASLATLAVAVSFLTFVRMVPVWLALIGTPLSVVERLCLGWFGPRGLASVLFALMVVDRFDVPNGDEIIACVVLTVSLSIVLHGLSAAPMTRYFAARKPAGERKTSPQGATE